MAAQYSEFRIVVDVCHDWVAGTSYYDYFTDFECEKLSEWNLDDILDDTKIYT